MTSPVDCPQPDNMAAIALQLQETAMQAEQALYETELAFAAALNRPTWVIDQTTGITGIPANQDFDLFNSGATFVQTFNNTGTDLFGGPMLPYTGLWQVGFAIGVTASGAVNAGSKRDFIIVHARFAPASVTGITEFAREESSLIEPNTGIGTDGTVVADFFAQAGDIIKFFVNHGNTSSTLNVPAPGPLLRYWATLLSTDDQVKVVT